MIRNHFLVSSLLLALAPAAAIAETKDKAQDPPPAQSTFIVSLDYQLGTYLGAQREDAMGMQTMETLVQPTYALAIRGGGYDLDKKTPLGAIPGVWFDIGLGWIGSTNPEAEFGDRDKGGGGGILWNIRMAGPWKLITNDNFKLGAGIGFSFGIEMGLPKGVGRPMDFLTADAFVMGVSELKIGGLRTLIEGEYAAGAGYNEQRAFGGIRFGKLTLGVSATAGQSEINYFRIGGTLGIAFDRDKLF